MESALAISRTNLRRDYKKLFLYLAGFQNHSNLITFKFFLDYPALILMTIKVYLMYVKLGSDS